MLPGTHAVIKAAQQHKPPASEPRPSTHPLGLYLQVLYADDSDNFARFNSTGFSVPQDIGLVAENACIVNNQVRCPWGWQVLCM